MASEPYGLESRIGRVEQEQARHDQRLANVEGRVDALTPLMTSVVTLTVEFKNLREDLSAFMKRVEDREEARDENRMAQKRWVIGLGVALVAALIGAVAVIVSAHS